MLAGALQLVRDGAVEMARGAVATEPNRPWLALDAVGLHVACLAIRTHRARAADGFTAEGVAHDRNGRRQTLLAHSKGGVEDADAADTSIAVLVGSEAGRAGHADGAIIVDNRRDWAVVADTDLGEAENVVVVLVVARHTARAIGVGPVPARTRQARGARVIDHIVPFALVARCPKRRELQPLQPDTGNAVVPLGVRRTAGGTAIASHVIRINDHGCGAVSADPDRGIGRSVAS